MPLPGQVTRPQPLATGLLTNKPIAHLLVYALDRKLTGTFELVDEARERMHIALAQGKVTRVWTSECVIYLGHVLYENGIITGEQLSASLAEVAGTKRLHGQVMLAKGFIQPEQLADALRQQRARKLHHAFALSGRTTFAFYPDIDLVGERPFDVEPMGPLPAIWRGIKAHPSLDHVRATLATVAARRLRIVGSLEGLGLDPQERAAAESLRVTAMAVADLARKQGLEPQALEVLAYFLVITKLAEIVERISLPSFEAQRVPVNSLGVALGSGEHVRKMSFAMRAVGVDSQSLRIPSPMPGKLTAQPRAPIESSRPAADVRRGNPEVEQALSQAEMHFVLGEREEAVVLARKALSVAPEMPEAMVLLAYLEALGLKDGQESFLRDLLKMTDAAIAKDETCRRGRFYRAEIKKRLGDHEGAITDLRIAVMNDPDEADAQRELRAYEQKVRDGSIVLRTTSGTPSTRPSGLLDRLRGK